MIPLPPLEDLREFWYELVTHLLMGASAFLAVASWTRPARRGGLQYWVRSIAATAAFVAATGLPVYPWGMDARQAFFPGFPDYYRGWMALDRASGPAGSRVAYAGTNIPYYLLGVGLRNDVRYVNVDARRDWLLHDYHRDALRNRTGPVTWPHPRPGWDRLRPDYPAWLANFRAEGIRLLVVTRADRENGPHNIADQYGFPVERAGGPTTTRTSSSRSTAPTRGTPCSGSTG